MCSSDLRAVYDPLVDSCYPKGESSEYRGLTETTKSGRACMLWTAIPADANAPAITAGNGLGHHAYCRDPDSKGKPYCFRKDAPFFKEVAEALSAQGLSDEYLMSYWQLLAGVLHLGNITFDQSKTDVATVTKQGMESLPLCEEVLGLQRGVMLKGLSKSKLRINKEFVEKDLSLMQATDNRDALSKAIYARLFDHLRTTINAALDKANTGVLGDRALRDTLSARGRARGAG